MFVPPPEYRCCVCWEVPETVLQTECNHRLCDQCHDKGRLEDCPVCRISLPEPTKRKFACFKSETENAVVTCFCGALVPLLKSDDHSCDHLKKKRRPEEMSPHLKGRTAPESRVNFSTFTCPICSKTNLDREGMIEHCEKEHGSEKKSWACVCPICAIVPGAEPRTRDFVRHLLRDHGYDFEFYASVEDSEEAQFEQTMRNSLIMLGLQEEVEADELLLKQVLEASLREAGGHGEEDKDAPMRGSSSSSRRSTDMDDDGDGSSDDSAGSSSGSSDDAERGRGPASSSSSSTSFGRGIDTSDVEVHLTSR